MPRPVFRGFLGSEPPAHAALFPLVLVAGVVSQISTPSHEKAIGPVPLGHGPDRVCCSVAYVSPLVSPTRKPQLRNGRTTLPDTAIARFRVPDSHCALYASLCSPPERQKRRPLSGLGAFWICSSDPVASVASRTSSPSLSRAKERGFVETARSTPAPDGSVHN
jgi:hypothetical protein